MSKDSNLQYLKTNNVYHQNGKSTLEVLEFARNYNTWIASQLLPYITPPALEIGSGIGNITQLLLSKQPLYLSDLDMQLVKKLKMRFSHEIEAVHQLDIENSVLPNYKQYFSSIYAINVLEHISNDRIALQHIHHMLKPGGRIILLVPAKKFAYSRLDKELGHFRRYEKLELMKLVQDSGFRIEKNYYFNIVGLLSWFVRDKLDADHTQLKAYQIRLFEGIVPILRVIESKIAMPVGISLIVVGQKV